MNDLNTGMTKYTNHGLVNFANGVFAALSRGDGARYFPVTSPSLAELLVVTKSFSDSLALGNNPSDALERKKRRAPLVTTLQLLADDLMWQAKGDRVKLAHTGFELRKHYTKSSALPPAPAWLKVKPTGFPGEVVASCGSDELGISYLVEWTHDPLSGEWNRLDICSNSRKMVFGGLQRGKDTWFRARMLGRRGLGPWSGLVSLMVC